MMKFILAFLMTFLITNSAKSNSDSCEPLSSRGFPTGYDEVNYSDKKELLRVGVIGLSHGHVHGILNRDNDGDIEIVGIVESNQDLAVRYSRDYGYSMDIVYNTIEEMLDEAKPEAVMAFNSIYDHMKVVEYCAPRGIHIMVEKPLAANLKDAEKMVVLAKKNKIHLITNYETTWYGSNTDAYKIINEEKKIGDIRKIIFYTGHQGPIEIGCNAEFLEWLTDPVLNGGGALTDFGCYGANLATWLMKGETPETVTCITQHIKPVLYPKVDDEATIILTYPTTQVIIQASWNWPFSRKEMEVYGNAGYVICKNGQDMIVKGKENEIPNSIKANDLPQGIQDPFAFFVKVIKENFKIEPYSPSSLENNRIVMQILEAAKHSSETGSKVIWDEFFKSEPQMK
jgi:predicted dehydrogenase